MLFRHGGRSSVPCADCFPKSMTNVQCCHEESVYAEKIALHLLDKGRAID